MDLEQFREYCLSKVAATENMPFGEGVLVFKVAGKIFALEHWNTVELDSGIPETELRKMIDHSYELVVQKLPRKVRRQSL
ncbi:MAG: hypothetical protein DME87_07330 [Verrucomicrobia bacterium]|nr:MAG: hypothetical protein DME87_07330 [Verrucomicrobiota bacterium]